MDQPVVVMERLPENVVKYYLKKSNSNGFDYNSVNWLTEKYKKYKKTHHRKKKQKKFNLDTVINLETDNDWEILNRSTTTANDNSDKANIVHIMRQSKVCDNKESADVKYPVSTFNDKNINTLIENTNLTNENNTCNSTENVITKKDIEENSGPNIKISLSHSTSENTENSFCNDEWQVISEASCSDISRSSSPYEGGIKPIDNVRYSTDLSNISKHSTNHQNLQCTTKEDEYQNIVLSECCDVYAFDEDDKLTEPYKSDCDDNISSPLNLKISDTSEQYSENSSNKSQKEFISDNLAKGDKLQLDRIPDASILNNLSQILDNSQKRFSQEYSTNKDFKLTAQKQELNPPLDTIKFTCQISNIKYSESLDNLQNEQQMTKTERLLPNSLTITPIFQENETSGNKTSALKLINKSDLLNQKHILDENENNQIKEFDYNKQVSLNATKNDSQYDVVGLIMKTMDKTKSCLITRKSSVNCSDNVVDNIMKTMETTKSFLITRKSSMEGTDSEVSKSSDNESNSVKNDTSIICKLKQKKARMSMSSAKVSCHRDSSYEDISFNNENLNKNLDLQNINDMKHQNESINTDLKKIDIDVSSDNTNLSIKAINKRKLKIPVSSENKKIKTHGIKKLKFCWRCGKKYVVHSFNDKLCKQCTSLDYTKLSSSNLKCYSDSEYISDKETIAGDQSDQSTVSEPSFIYLKNSKQVDKEEDKTLKISNEDPKLSFSKSFDKTSTLYNKPVDLSTNKINSSCDKANSVPPLKLIVSINQKNLKKSIYSGKNKFDLKLKKRRKASNINTVHKTYQIDTTIKQSEHMENENIICKILKKQKNKDLLKKRKKSNIIEPDTTESDALEKEESKVKKLKISKTLSEIIATQNTIQTETSEEIIKESKDKNKENSERENNKKGTCEVINVNRGLFLLSFPEADDDLDPNIFNFPPEKSQIQNSETDEKNISSNITQDKTDKSIDNQLNCSHSEKETVLESNSNYASKTSLSINTEESTKENSVFLNKQERENLQTTIRLSDDLKEKSESFCDDTLQLQTDPLDLMGKRINTKNMKTELALTNDKDLLVNKSIPKIENVFSLRDMPIEQLQEEKHPQSIPSVNNCNVYNELDAYATASILELEQSQEHSVILLTTILAREFKELHKICLMEKSTNFSLELYNVKMRKIDTIRSLQLACALLTKGQKCKTELSPSMLHMPSEEMSQLLSLCNDIYHNKLSEALSSKNEESGQKKSVTTTSSDKTDQSDLINKKNGINEEMSQHTINIQNTINSLLTPPVLNPLPIISFTTNYNHPTNFRCMPNIPVNANKLDDDVICLGTSNVRNSVIHNQQKEQITVNKVIQNKSQFSTSVSSKDERPGNLTIKQAVTLSELSKSNNPQVENSGSAKSQAINKTVLKNNQVTVNIVNNTPVYQKVSFGFNENGNYIPSSNQSSNTAQKGTEERKSSPQSQIEKPVTSNWGQTSTTDVRNISRIQNQWSSQALGKQGLSVTQSNNNDRTAGSPAWRNSVSSHNSSSVPNQQRPIQPNIRPSSTLVPILNQFGTLITRPPLLQGNIPVHAGRNIAQVPMFNIHTQGVIRTWHQPPNTPAQVSSHQSQQSPIVCITCRKPISMTCPTGMFCSELCKKAYCAMFPNYR